MTTMIESEDPGLYVGILSGIIWDEAVERIIAGEIPQDNLDRIAFWQAAGIVVDDKLDPMWAKAIHAAQGSRIGCELVSTYDGVVFHATVLIDRQSDSAVCITDRGTIEADQDGVERVAGVHPMTEVAIAPVNRVWSLIRRVLPPLEELRSQPQPTAQSEAKELSLQGIEIPERMRANPETFAQHLQQLPNLPGPFYDLFDAKANVFSYTLVSDGNGVRTSGKTWALGDKLYLIDADTASAWEVPPGNLGYTLVRDLLG